MNGRAYYNEIDPFAASWLRELIAAGHIAPGDVDERSIADVRPDDVRGYSQCHFFAGIGGWSCALRLAGWPDERPVWTGSCPCQPFSAAGKGKAADDERHLWPAWFPLIVERRPSVVFGEQVEAAIGWGWLDAVLGDLESEGYACGASVLPACAVDAPHKRERVWFVADADGQRQLRWSQSDGAEDQSKQQAPRRDHSDGCGSDVAHAASSGQPQPQWSGAPIHRTETLEFAGLPSSSRFSWKPEPDVGRVAHGIPARVGRLRAYGNAIVPQVAAEFIGAFLDHEREGVR